MSRRHSSELDFGSDSFLDIIANIVGILIILIVVAGVRAARTPVVDDSTTPTESPPTPPPVVIVEKPVPPKPDVPAPVPQPLPAADESIPDQIRTINARLAQARSRNANLKTRLSNATIARQAAEDAHSTAIANLQQAALSKEKASDRTTRLKQSMDRNRATLAQLRRQYDEAARKPDNVKTIQHRLTPIGRDVNGTEVHFRIAGGKVAHVPVKGLVKRMREEVIRRKNWLMKFPTHKGTVGPVKGFTMEYTVQRQLTSVVNELRSGYGAVRIMLAGWKILPAADLETETVDEALRNGSRFLQEVRVAPDTATITFWVYPDSFKQFRQLQAAVRADGLRVAARPLPFGIPIAGSPRGSRSSGQ